MPEYGYLTDKGKSPHSTLTLKRAIFLIWIKPVGYEAVALPVFVRGPIGMPESEGSHPIYRENGYLTHFSQVHRLR